MPSSIARSALAVALLVATAAVNVFAASTLPLPVLALDPAPDASAWRGLYVGTEVAAIGARGGRGGFGAAAYGGYERAFGNGLLLDVQGTSGTTPLWFGPDRLRRLDYAAGDVQIGYDMGRLVPFVTAGVALARPRFGQVSDVFRSDSLNGALNGPGRAETFARVGVGAVYAISNNLSIGVAVSTVNGPGVLLP